MVALDSLIGSQEILHREDHGDEGNPSYATLFKREFFVMNPEKAKMDAR